MSASEPIPATHHPQVYRPKVAAIRYGYREAAERMAADAAKLQRAIEEVCLLSLDVFSETALEHYAAQFRHRFRELAEQAGEAARHPTDPVGVCHVCGHTRFDER